MAGLDPAIFLAPAVRKGLRRIKSANDVMTSERCYNPDANQPRFGSPIASMIEEDLRRPLRRRSSFDRLWAAKPSPITAAATGLLVAAAGTAFWLARSYDPGLGEPVVHLRIEPVDLLKTASIAPAADDAASIEESVSPEEVVIEGLETTETDTAVIVAPPVRLASAPARGFTEKGADGLLPKVAGDGRRPFDVYARPVHRAVLDSEQPKIAILLGGMGLNGELTGRAEQGASRRSELRLRPLWRRFAAGHRCRPRHGP